MTPMEFLIFIGLAVTVCNCQTLVHFSPSESGNSHGTPVAAGFAYAFRTPSSSNSIRSSSKFGGAPKSLSVSVVPVYHAANPTQNVYRKEKQIQQQLVVPQVVKTQYHSQDELGQYAYGYVHNDASHHEERSVHGGVTGSYSYYDKNGVKQSTKYEAGRQGFRVHSSNLPVANPVPVKHTPEVLAATFAHLQAVEKVKARKIHGRNIHVGIRETPEVAAARAAHLLAFNKIKQQHARRLKRSAQAPTYFNLGATQQNTGVNVQRSHIAIPSITTSTVAGHAFSPNQGSIGARRINIIPQYYPVSYSANIATAPQYSPNTNILPTHSLFVKNENVQPFQTVHQTIPTFSQKQHVQPVQTVHRPIQETVPTFSQNQHINPVQPVYQTGPLFVQREQSQPIQTVQNPIPAFVQSEHLQPVQTISETVPVFAQREQVQPVLKTVHKIVPAPVETSKPEPLILKQYHSQDEFGQYEYGYSGGPSERHETKDKDGVIRGYYSHVDANGNLQRINYQADDVNGYKIVPATNIPNPAV